MTQQDRRTWLIQALLDERGEPTNVPADPAEQKHLLRALFNVRPPMPVREEFLQVQDAYLQEETRQKGITDYRKLPPVQPGIYLWQGDITTLRCGAVVNAANSQLLGCFRPGHNCIDNAIHTFSGVQLRLHCAELMSAQSRPEPTGRAKLTPAYNLPCDFILHTVGPIISGPVTPQDEQALQHCYTSCLELAEENDIDSVAFCCISTGVFGFPNQRAAELAVRAVREYRAKTNSRIEVIFNVFKDVDQKLYRELLCGN